MIHTHTPRLWLSTHCHRSEVKRPLFQGRTLHQCPSVVPSSWSVPIQGFPDWHLLLPPRGFPISPQADRHPRTPGTPGESRSQATGSLVPSATCPKAVGARPA